MLHVTLKFYPEISYHKRIAHQQRCSSKANSMTIRSWSQKFRPVNTVVVSDAVWAKNKIRMKKALRETQTRRAGCSKAEPQIFAPAADLLPAARGVQHFISWRRKMVTILLPKNRPTHTPANTARPPGANSGVFSISEICSPPLPSLRSLPSLPVLSFPFHSPPWTWKQIPLNPTGGSGCAVSSHSGVSGRAPAEVEFVAF